MFRVYVNLLEVKYGEVLYFSRNMTPLQETQPAFSSALLAKERELLDFKDCGEAFIHNGFVWKFGIPPKWLF